MSIDNRSSYPWHSCQIVIVSEGDVFSRHAPAFSGDFKQHRNNLYMTREHFNAHYRAQITGDNNLVEQCNAKS